MIPASLEEIRDERAGVLYPREILGSCQSALLLFCAGFYGRNDGICVADADVANVIGIDINNVNLKVMAKLYPWHWQFICTDAYSWADTTREWFDLVSIDSPIHDCARVVDRLPLWCSLARYYVVLTVMASSLAEAQETELPGWQVRSVTKRNDYMGGCFWLTLERA